TYCRRWLRSQKTAFRKGPCLDAMISAKRHGAGPARHPEFIATCFMSMPLIPSFRSRRVRAANRLKPPCMITSLTKASLWGSMSVSLNIQANSMNHECACGNCSAQQQNQPEQHACVCGRHDAAPSAVAEVHECMCG